MVVRAVVGHSCVRGEEASLNEVFHISATFLRLALRCSSALLPHEEVLLPYEDALLPYEDALLPP